MTYVFSGYCFAALMFDCCGLCFSSFDHQKYFKCIQIWILVLYYTQILILCISVGFFFRWPSVCFAVNARELVSTYSSILDLNFEIHMVTPLLLLVVLHMVPHLGKGCLVTVLYMLNDITLLILRPMKK